MIEFQDVSVAYQSRRRGRDQVTAVQDINLKIDAGEWVFIVGPSGAGKSTLLKLLYAGVQATSGRVMMDGQDITRLAPRQIPLLRRKLGVVFQDFQLLTQKSVWENVAFALQVIGAPQKRLAPDVARALDIVGLAHRADAHPHELSGGEQQRVAIARAIVNDPSILLADEPTGNLDPQTGWEIVQVLRRINERGTTVLMATHDRTIVDALKQRVVRLANGRIVSDAATGVYHHAGSEPAQLESPLLAPSYHEEHQPEAASTPALTVTWVDEPDAPDIIAAYDDGSQGDRATPSPEEPGREEPPRPGEADSYLEKTLKNKAPIGSPENPIVQFNRVMK